VIIVKLREVVTYRKQFIEISDQESYKRCRVQLHRRGVKLRDITSGSNIKTKKQRLCQADDFIVAEMDAKFGGYGIIPEELHGAIVSSHYYLYELDQNRLLPAYLTVIIDSGVFEEQIKAVGSTNYSRVSAKEVLEYEVPCPSLDGQRRIIDFYFSSKEKCFGLGSELTHQQTLLKKLRQQILQEAIEGKLTADWRAANPDVEPASELLVRIKAEKEQLIQAKKIKNQKILPPITAEEKPFDLPDGWAWCLLDAVVHFTNGKAHEQFIDSSGKYILVNSKYISMNGKVVKRTAQCMCPVYKNDILIVMSDVPNGKALARCFLVDEDDSYSMNQRIGALRPLADLDPNFFKLVVERNSHFLSFDDGKKQTNLRKGQILSCPLAIPSLSEQTAIVIKVKRILSICDQLEVQIASNQNYADQLVQAVLKEAFEVNPSTEGVV